MLKEIFIDLAKRYSNDDDLIHKFWHEIAEAYSQKDKHYHTLTHLDHMYSHLLEVKSLISNWETVLFSLYYHDIVYHVKASDNEEQSAQLGERRMKQLHVPVDIIEVSKNQILATKTHLQDEHSDTNYFTDADLAVLGQDWETYQAYAENVRKEYAVYPDSLYNPGRKKALQHFLEMDRIFKTDYFYEKFEVPARQNILKETMLY
jgi:predicted metal-dependent HD superfamily phosphohydrolase